MYVGLPEWLGRVSPVLDVAGTLVAAEVDCGVVRDRRALRFVGEDVCARAQFVADQGIEVLICCALSWPLERMLRHAGVQVVPHICGEIGLVLEAYACGRLEQSAFIMPGCCGNRRAWMQKENG